tara:strand:- start:70 stop:1506 length:1437 start_codon:yes stop_codon:yes gene_type:complete
MNIIQQKVKIFRFTDRLFDSFLIYAAILSASMLNNIYHIHPHNLIQINPYMIVSIIIIWQILIQIFEYNLIYRHIHIIQIVKNVFSICLIGITSLISLAFLLQISVNNRFVIICFGIIVFIFLIIKRGLLKYFLSYIRHEGINAKNIIIVGASKRAVRLIKELYTHQEYGIKIIAIINPNSSPLNDLSEYVNKIQIVNGMDSFRKIIDENDIDEIFFAVDMTIVPNINSIFTYLDTIGVSYHMMINEAVYNYTNEKIDTKTSYYYGIPMLSFHAISASYIKLHIKTIIEKIFSFFLLILSLPILVIVGIIIKFTSSGPIIFKQQRVGLRGRKFYQYKLRSMIIDAEKQKDKLIHLNEQKGPIFKIKNDPRLTPIGKIIRKFSIDELPQLINVLLGSMNLIGPRPPVPEEVEKYNDIQIRRLSMKPGITGLWQVSGRNAMEDFNDWVKLDLEYIDNWSFLLDVKIALKTIQTILSGNGH